MAPASGREKMADAEVEGARFKVVWSCLLLLEMVMDDVACAAHFQTLATNVVGKVSELFRLFNSRSTHLVFGAGAIHSAARLKSINAKHLAIVTQCIALVLAILPHVRAALMAQLPSKQHSLLNELDKIKGEYTEHSEKILNKLVSIIGGIVEHSLASKIVQSNFDTRAKSAPSLENKSDFIIQCCPFLDSVITNTKKMHQVLNMMLPPDLLQDVFSRIFAYLDHKVPSLFKIAASSGKKGNPPAANFSMPCTDDGKLQMVREVEHMTKTLNSLSGVQPWNFTAMKVLEQELDIRSPDQSISQIPVEENNGDQPDVKSDEKKEMDEDDQSVTGSAEKQAPVPVDVSNDQDIGLNEEIGQSSSIVREVDDKVNISKQDSRSVNIDIATSTDYNETNGVHPSESKIPEGGTIACTKGGDSVVGTDTSVDKEGEDGGIIADSAGVDQNDAIVNGGMP